MRNIKFRAWDKEANYFLNDFVVANDGDIICFDTDGVAQAIDAELMQFTGLQDKNGVDIYEGDIVNDKFNCDQLQIIRYSDEKACFIGEWIGFKSPKEKNYESPLSTSTETITEGVVIGNIHSNPELLEQ